VDKVLSTTNLAARHSADDPYQERVGYKPYLPYPRGSRIGQVVQYQGHAAEDVTVLGRSSV
jgi:hypothetical protein